MTDPISVGLVGYLKSAFDLVKSLKELKEISSAHRAQLFELYEVIVAGQASALEESLKQRTLLDTIRELEEKLRAVEEWETTKQRYVLTEFIPGNYAYALKKSAHPPEPPHLICEQCYQKKQKFLLHYFFEHGVGQTMRCSNCKTTHYLPNGRIAVNYAE
jgi:hypothetical protein